MSSKSEIVSVLPVHKRRLIQKEVHKKPRSQDDKIVKDLLPLWDFAFTTRFVVHPVGGHLPSFHGGSPCRYMIKILHSPYVFTTVYAHRNHCGCLISFVRSPLPLRTFLLRATFGRVLLGPTFLLFLLAVLPSSLL